MTFKDAVAGAAPPANTGYRRGIQALEGRHRELVHCADSRQLTGSINLDKVLEREPGYANAPRWDYGLGYKPKNASEQAVWVEVHPAATKEVSAVLKKLAWLKDWLNGNAQQLNRMTYAGNRDNRFVWIATSSIKIPPHSRQAKLLSSRGLNRPRKRLCLH